MLIKSTKYLILLKSSISKAAYVRKWALVEGDFS